MITMNEKNEIIFDQLNVINFWLIEFTSIETKKTLKEKYISWIRNDLDDNLYKHFYTTALTIILKYCILSIRMLKREVYKITISTFLHCILTFDLYKDVAQLMKLALVCWKAQKTLDLGFCQPYMNDAITKPLLEIKNKSHIDVTSLQLVPDICATNTFYQALLDLPELQFVPSPSLFNDQHNDQYTHEVIVINNEFGIYPGLYYFNTLSLPVFTIEIVDKVVCCYTRLLLA